MPAERETTCPLGHVAIAALICEAVAPGISVAQTVARTGMPPTTPAWDQSMARVGSMMPDQSPALGAVLPLPAPLPPTPEDVAMAPLAEVLPEFALAALPAVAPDGDLLAAPHAGAHASAAPAASKTAIDGPRMRE